MTYVLVIHGRKDEVEKVTLEVFNDLMEAREYCKSVNYAHEDKKYWKSARIIDESIDYSLHNFIIEKYNYDYR